MMALLGVRWKRPTAAGIQSVVVLTAVTGTLAYLIVPRLGGSIHHMAGLTAIALVTTWLSESGASYERAGLRGMAVTTAAGALAWVATLAASVIAGI
jgi:hypothetical protein